MVAQIYQKFSKETRRYRKFSFSVGVQISKSTMSLLIQRESFVYVLLVLRDQTGLIRVKTKIL